MQQKGFNNQYMTEHAVLDATLIEKIISTMIELKSIMKSLKLHGVSNQAFFMYLSKNPSAEGMYAHAQASIAELYAEDVVEIADSAVDSSKARNQIDARKWYASKTKPSKYGERIDLNINQIVDIGSALAEAQKRAQLPVSPLTQVIDVTPLNDKSDTGYKPVDAAETKDASELSIDEILK